MIGKHFKRQSVRPLLNYITRKEGSAYIGGNTVGTTVDELSLEFKVSQWMNPKIEKPIYHISLSCPHHEHLDSATWEQFACDYIEKIGYKDCQWAAYRHTDREHDHVHLVVSRIQMTDGKTVDASWDYYRSQQALRELEEAYELTPVESSWEVGDRAMSLKERKLYDQTGIPSVRQQLQDTLKAIAQSSPTMSDFIEQVREAGIEMKGCLTPAGEFGLSYKLNGVALPASKLGKNYTFRGLQVNLGIDFEPDRDKPVLMQIAPPTPEQEAMRQPLSEKDFMTIATRYFNHEYKQRELPKPAPGSLQADWGEYQFIYTKEPTTGEISFRVEAGDRGELV
jgi:hypothetical protein